MSVDIDAASFDFSMDDRGAITVVVKDSATGNPVLELTLDDPDHAEEMLRLGLEAVLAYRKEVSDGMGDGSRIPTS